MLASATGCLVVVSANLGLSEGLRLSRAGFLNLKRCDQRFELSSLFLERHSGRTRFLNKRGILLGHGVHLRYRRIDLLDTCDLLTSRGGHFTHQYGQVLNAGFRFFDGSTTLFGLLSAKVDLGVYVFQQFTNLAGGLGTTASEYPHFAGHDDETTPLASSGISWPLQFAQTQGSEDLQSPVDQCK